MRENSFWISFALFAAVVLVVAGFYWKGIEPEDAIGSVENTNRVGYEAQEDDAFFTESALLDQRTETRNGSSVDSSFADAPEESSFTTEELLMIDDWYRENGYYLRDDYSDYESYDQRTLEELAKGGDITALQVLASTADDSRDRMSYRLQAAARGSIYDIQEIANEHMAQIQHAQHSNDAELLSFHKVQFLAWYKVMEMRGLGNAGEIASNYENMLNLTLSDDEEAAVIETTNENYLMIKTIRDAMGYDSFSNQPPELLEQFFQYSNSEETQHITTDHQNQR